MTFSVSLFRVKEVYAAMLLIGENTTKLYYTRLVYKLYVCNTALQIYIMHYNT